MRNLRFALIPAVLFLLPGFGYAGWVQQQSGIINSVENVRFPNSTCGWAVAGTGTMDSVLHTTDGGQTWIKQDLGQLVDPTCLSFLDTLKGWLGGGPIMKTTNGGSTWDSVSRGEKELGMSFVDSLTGWLSGWDGFMEKTRDGGRTWSPESIGVRSSMFDVCFVDSLYGWSVGNYFNDTSHCIIATTNGGATWQIQQYVIFSYSLYGVWFVDRLHGWAVGDDYILATADGGKHWNVQYSSIYYFKGVHFVDTLRGWVVGTGGSVVATTDGGVTWTLQTTPTTNTLRGVWFADSLRGWAVGDGGTILHTEDGGWTGVLEEPSRLTPYTSRYTVTPNPFVSYTPVPGHSSERFNLYDISGRRVGTYKGDRIGEGLAAGVYFLGAADGSSKPVRIVKIR